MDKSWRSNFENAEKNKKSGECPYCKSGKTNYAFHKFTKDNWGCGAVWCENCKAAFYISRMKVSDEILKPIEIPKNLIYKGNL
jgi:transcription elongation factor Elf1